MNKTIENTHKNHKIIASARVYAAAMLIIGKYIQYMIQFAIFCKWRKKQGKIDLQNKLIRRFMDLLVAPFQG